MELPTDPVLPSSTSTPKSTPKGKIDPPTDSSAFQTISTSEPAQDSIESSIHPPLDTTSGPLSLSQLPTPTSQSPLEEEHGSSLGSTTSQSSSTPKLSSPFTSPKMADIGRRSDVSADSSEIKDATVNVSVDDSPMVKSPSSGDMTVEARDTENKLKGDTDVERTPEKSVIPEETIPHTEDDDGNVQGGIAKNVRPNVERGSPESGQEDVESDDISYPENKILRLTAKFTDETTGNVQSSDLDPVEKDEATQEPESLSSDIQTPVDTPVTTSIPPHLRPRVPALLRPTGLQPSSHAPVSPLGPRTPDTFRGGRPPFQRFQPAPPFRREDDRDELMRMQAMLAKTRQDLVHERMNSQNARQAAEAEALKTTQAVTESMLKSIMQKEMDVAKQALRVREKELDLERRVESMVQLEIFLAEGQKQIKYHLGEQGERAWEDVERIYAERQGEVAALAKHREVEMRLEAKAQQLNIREAAQDVREHQYTARTRPLLEREIRHELHEQFSERLAEVEARVAEADYNRGFSEGKEAGLAQGAGEAHDAGFLDGYNACYRNQTALMQFRAGRIPHDSPDLDFLTDPDHPENPFHVGKQVGMHERNTTAAKVGVVKDEDAKVKREAKEGQVVQMVNGHSGKETKEHGDIPEVKVNGHAYKRNGFVSEDEPIDLIDLY